MKSSYMQRPDKTIETQNRTINIFNISGKNIDKKVVDEFGDEWLKFNRFTDKRIKEAAAEYFDIVDENIINDSSYVLDIGCGTGRWTKYISSRVAFVEAVDPSDAIFAADKLLRDTPNVRLTRASIDTLPFADETFDFVMSIGVLHHVPDTLQGVKDCVKKVKKGGHFYIYLYYNLESRGLLFRTLFKFSDAIRRVVSRLPGRIKRMVCDVLAVTVYMPLIYWVRFLYFLGLKNFAQQMPLSAYYNKSFFIIRNDSLDRFGTRLERRFSQKEIYEMMQDCGLSNITISAGIPYYHAIGKKA